MEALNFPVAVAGSLRIYNGFRPMTTRNLHSPPISVNSLIVSSLRFSNSSLERDIAAGKSVEISKYTATEAHQKMSYLRLAVKVSPLKFADMLRALSLAISSLSFCLAPIGIVIL